MLNLVEFVLDLTPDLLLVALVNHIAISEEEPENEPVGC